MVRAFAAFNPHCTLTATWGAEHQTYAATDPTWKHWQPDQPTAPHWYTLTSFRQLVAALLAHERTTGKVRTLNEFVHEFHGLSSTSKAKAILQAADLSGALLQDLVLNQDVDDAKAGALLTAMQQAARPVKPEALGLLGEAHCRTSLEQFGAVATSIKYKRSHGESAPGMPYCLEVAFGLLPAEYEVADRHLIVGINFSPSLRQPFEALTEARCTAHDPVVLLVHLACPQVQYADRGKSRATLPATISDDLKRLVKLVTAEFTKAKRRADREDRLAARDLEALRNANQPQEMDVKEAAWQVLPAAYLKASGNGTLPANARQIMYAARPGIIKLTGKIKPWKNTAYFTQTLLPDYINAHPEPCANWDVVYDDRGHFEEPHTGQRIGIGTLAVRRHIGTWGKSINTEFPKGIDTRLITTGPALRYRFALFVEKEGFTELLEKSQIAKRYDLALMSAKGMSVTAARQLVEALTREGVTILVVRDFDKYGFSIFHTLANHTRRYRFTKMPQVIDLGMRLSDVAAMDLPSEAVEYKGKNDPRPFLLSRGATQDEADFLVTGQQDGHWLGQRVELNAMDSPQFIDWLERKLEQYGVTKFVPNDPTDLHTAWQRAWRITRLNMAIAKAVKNLPASPNLPDDLHERVRTALQEQPCLSWDAALLQTLDTSQPGPERPPAVENDLVLSN